MTRTSATAPFLRSDAAAFVNGTNLMVDGAARQGGQIRFEVFSAGCRSGSVAFVGGV
ncbi:hypothetical protein [Streptomyces sp. SAS_260]|uniref:hypothetical protein n=1 Tax=Streptomyces sp. SAS_260 TaxID=3412751 RepID=UPI00403D45CC